MRPRYISMDPWEYSSQWSRLFYDHQLARHPLQQYPKTPNWCKLAREPFDRSGMPAAYNIDSSEE